MKVIILAGGFGIRLSEYTESIPKPMVTIGGKPILWHIMNTYAKFEYKDFYLALGYKAEVVKRYFLNYSTLNSDFTVDLSNGDIVAHQQDKVDWKVTLVDTGLNSMTGGRVKRMQDHIGDEAFLLSYGDGVADVDLILRFIVDHDVAVAADARHVGLNHIQCSGGCDGRIHGVSAFLEDGHPGLGSQRMPGAHHPVPAHNHGPVRLKFNAMG